MAKPTDKTDDLLNTSPEGAIELDETALDNVAGGNKAKTADKAFKQYDDYIRS